MLPSPSSSSAGKDDYTKIRVSSHLVEMVVRAVSTALLDLNAPSQGAGEASVAYKRHIPSAHLDRESMSDRPGAKN